ncbi:MAG: hypothetical protein WAW92_04515 [Minisyncoccia bacterium]
MPQVNPIGGLSLIIHILINIVCFFYEKTLSVFGLSSNNPLSRFFGWLNGEKGETTARKYLSYVTLFSIITFITLNVAFVSTKQYSLRINESTELFSNVKNYILGTYVEKKTEINEGNTAVEIQYGNTDLGHIIKTDSVATRIINASDTYLVDFMIEVGITDISFENRARIAKDLNVVNSYDEYIGTSKQNKEMIAKLKSGAIIMLENNKQ